MINDEFTIAILTYNRKDKLIRLIESILSTTPMDRIKEIVAYNNNSTDGTVEELNHRKFNKVRIFNFEHNTRNRAKRWNFMLKNSTTEWTFLMEDDIYVLPEWFECWTQFIKDYILINNGGYSLALFSKKVLSLIGYFDEGFCDGEYEDIDYSQRIASSHIKIKEIENDKKTFIHDYIPSHRSMTSLHGLLSKKYYKTKYRIDVEEMLGNKEKKRCLHIGYHIIDQHNTDNIRPDNNVYTLLDTKPYQFYDHIIISTLDGRDFIPEKFIRILKLGGCIDSPERYLTDEIMTKEGLFLYQKSCKCIRLTL